MNDSFNRVIDQCCSTLKLDFSSAELAQLSFELGVVEEGTDFESLVKHFNS